MFRFLRLFPQFGQLEDLTEYARTGDVTSRFSDTSPLLGEDGTIPNKERTGPKQSGRGQSRLLSAVGIPVRTVDILEMMEQGLKDDKAALSEMTSKLTASRPEEREKLLEQMLRHQGEQRRGLEATDPGAFEREREQGYRRDRAPLQNRNQRKSTPAVAPH